MTLSQVDDFCSWEFLAVEGEGTVGDVLCLEAIDIDGAPGRALAHLHLRRHVGLLVDGDVHLCHGALLVVGYEVNLVVAAHGLEGALVARLVDIDEGIWIHRHLLCLGRVGDVHLIGLLHVRPLCLSVIPYDSLRRSCVELIALAYLSFLVATNGYDKVIQAIKQIKQIGNQ